MRGLGGRRHASPSSSSSSSRHRPASTPPTRAPAAAPASRARASSASNRRARNQAAPTPPQPPRLQPVPDVISSAQGHAQGHHQGQGQQEQGQGGEGQRGGSRGRSSCPERISRSSRNSTARVAMVTQGWGGGGASGGGGGGGQRNSNTLPPRSLAGMKVCIQGCGGNSGNSANSNRANTLSGVFPSTSGGGNNHPGGGRGHVEIRCSPPSLPQCRGHPLGAGNRHDAAGASGSGAVHVAPPVVPAHHANAGNQNHGNANANANANGSRTPEALPDILNSHVPPTSPVPPPYASNRSASSNPGPPPRHPLSGAVSAVPPSARTDPPRAARTSAAPTRPPGRWFSRLGASPVTTLDSTTSIPHPHPASRHPLGSLLASLQDKQCCTGGAVRRCLTLITTFRWVLVALALLGVACVITGIVLGSLHMSMGSSFLTLSLMFIGLGVLLVVVVGVGWRCTPPGHEPCHLLFHLGEHGVGGHPGDPRRPGDARRPLHWYGGVLYPEFRFRRPPPSYSASMQEYQQQQLMMAQLSSSSSSPCRHPPLPPPLPPGDEPSSDEPSSPPPTYRSQPSQNTLLRSGVHITFPLPPSDRSRPPTYRSVAGRGNNRPAASAIFENFGASGSSAVCVEGAGNSHSYSQGGQNRNSSNAETPREIRDNLTNAETYNENSRLRRTMTLQRYHHEHCGALGGGGGAGGCYGRPGASQSYRRACSTLDPNHSYYDTPPRRLHCSLENMLDQGQSQGQIQGQDQGEAQCQNPLCLQQHQQQQQQRYSMDNILAPQPHESQQEMIEQANQAAASGIDADRSSTLNRLVESNAGNLSTLQRSEQVVRYLDGLLDEQLRHMSGESRPESRPQTSDTPGTSTISRSCHTVGCPHATTSGQQRDNNNSNNNDNNADLAGDVADTPL